MSGFRMMQGFAKIVSGVAESMAQRPGTYPVQSHGPQRKIKGQACTPCAANAMVQAAKARVKGLGR